MLRQKKEDELHEAQIPEKVGGEGESIGKFLKQ